MVFNCTQLITKSRTVGSQLTTSSQVQLEVRKYTCKNMAFRQCISKKIVFLLLVFLQTLSTCFQNEINKLSGDMPQRQNFISVSVSLPQQRGLPVMGITRFWRFMVQCQLWTYMNCHYPLELLGALVLWLKFSLCNKNRFLHRC